MAKIIMDSGKEYEIDEIELDSIMYETVTINEGTPFSEPVRVSKLRTGLIRIPKLNISISPLHISSVENLEK